MPLVPSIEKLSLTIRNRKKVLYQSDVKAVTSLNDKGKFDILPEHAHFISIIKDYIIMHTLDGKDEKMTITNGVMKVEENHVNCYIDLIGPTK